jgi:hypothetical protein
MAELTEYKSGASWGLDPGEQFILVDGASGEAGAALTEDLKLLADRALVFHAQAAPGPDDDQNDGFLAGSRWLDTLSGRFYVCADSSPGEAVWKEVGGVSFPAGLKLPADNAKLVFGEGDDASIAYDGTNLVVNPKENGAGCLSVAGDLQAANFRTTETNCTLVGVSTGLWNTGVSNTFLGFAAGYSNTTGHNNLFVGLAAGFQNTSGALNVFLGSQAGYQNTSGSSNMFLGYNAGHANTTGTCNVFIGCFAGEANTSAGDNTFLGYAAGKENTSGNSNCFIGNAAGRYTTSGAANLFLGSAAGFSNQAGNNNTFIGGQAGYNSLGDHNTAIGYQAAFSTTSGAANIAIGNFAGYSNQTGTGNVFLGYQAGYYETGSNRLYIDNSNTSAPLVWGDFANDVLKFNGSVIQKGVTAAATLGNGEFTFHVDESNNQLVVTVKYADGTTKTGTIALS